MLQRIRDKVTGVVAFAFLALIAVVFIFWGLDFSSTGNAYAVKVNGERIPPQTVLNLWQQRQMQLQRMMEGELPSELVRAQQEALLDQFVRQTLLTQRAKEFGYQVSDLALVNRIREIPAFQVDGRFSQDRYIALIRQNGMTEAQFEADLRAELLIDQVQAGIVDSAIAAPFELERRYSLERQQRDLDYALVSIREFEAATQLTEEQVAAWYEQHKDEFASPETVDVHYVELLRENAQQQVEVTEAGLREYYEQVKERFQTQERRRASHILIAVDDSTDDAAAQKLAQELTDKAQSGADFAALAKEHSKDPGSAQQGGDLGWAEPGMFVGPFEEALFGMTAGEIRGPVKTQFGYHVIRLDEVEAGHTRSFEDARAELEDEYRNERSQSLFYDQTQALADQAFASLTDLQPVADALGLELKTVTGFTRQGGGDLGADPGVIEVAFSEEVLERGQNSPLVTIGEDRALVLRISNHKPSEPRPLAEVREQVVARATADAAREAAQKKGDDALARVRNGEAWSEALAAEGLKPVGVRTVTRNDSVAPAAVLRSAFEVPSSQVTGERVEYVSATTDDGNIAVISVSNAQFADASAEPASERATRRRMAERQAGTEEFIAYLQEAERTADVERNMMVFQ